MEKVMSNELMVNNSRMKRNEKLSSIIMETYILTCGSYIIIMIGIMLLTLFKVDVPGGLIGIMFKVIILGFGFAGVYCRKTMYAFGAPGAALLNFILLYDITTVPYLLLSVLLMLLTLLVNSVYNELSLLPGFPYFNERVNEQNNAPKEYIPQFQPLSPEKKGDMDDIPGISEDGKMDEI